MRRSRVAALILAAVLLVSGSPGHQSRAAATEPLVRMNQLLEEDIAAGLMVSRELFFSSAARLLMDAPESGQTLPFADADAIAPENAGFIGALYEAGIIAGCVVDGELCALPDGPVSRQDAFTVLARLLGRSSEAALEFADMDAVAPYALPYITWFVERGMIAGLPDGTLAPQRAITAGEMAVILLRAYDYAVRNRAQVSVIAGAGSGGYTDGKSEAARFTLPGGVFLDKDGALMVADTYSNLLRRVTEGRVTTLAGRVEALDEQRFPKGYYRDGAADEALMNRPTGGVTGADGTIYIADSENHAIRQIRDGRMSTLCGGEPGYADGPREKARLNGPAALAIDESGTLYVADTLNHCIRAIDPSGSVTTLAGMPGESGNRDGGAGSALFCEPSGIAVTPDGHVVYIADTGNHTIRAVRGGVVETVAGVTYETDEEGRPEGGFADGAALLAMLRYPTGLALAGEFLVIADTGNHTIRALTPDGQVVTVCGRGEPGDSGGSALEAGLNAPMGVCYDGTRLYIADTSNNRIKYMAFDEALYCFEGE